MSWMHRSYKIFSLKVNLQTGLGYAGDTPWFCVIHLLKNIIEKACSCRTKTIVTLSVLHIIVMAFQTNRPLQTPLPSRSSPGGRRRRGEEHHQQYLRREPQPGGRGGSRSLLTPAAASLSGGGGRRGLLRAFGRSESGQHHGLGLGHFLLPVLLVPRQRGPL